MCSTLSQAHVARARQLPQHLLQRQAPGTLPLQAPHLLHRPRFLAPFAIPRLRSRGGRLRLGLRLFGRFKRRRIPADVADQTLPLGPLDQRCVHPLRPLALRKFGERARAYALVRHPRRRLPTAQPPQHNVGPQSVQNARVVGRLNTALATQARAIAARRFGGHSRRIPDALATQARDRGAVMRRPAPPAAHLHKRVQLEQRQRAHQLLLQIAQRSQLGFQHRKQPALQNMAELDQRIA